jgi:hypothetical protein
MPQHNSILFKRQYFCVTAGTDPKDTWNREHVWPDSRGIGQPDSGADFSDMHHLRAANPSANSSRGNSYFDVGGNIAPVIQSPLAYTQRLSEIPISKLMKSLFSRNRENGVNVKIELPFTKTSLFTTT